MMFELKDEFTIPRMMISYGPHNDSSDRSLSENYTWDGMESSFSLSWENVYPEPFIISDDRVLKIVIGSPVVGEKIDKEAALAVFDDQKGINQELLKSVNGEFLLINYSFKDDKLIIVNDRFTSIPLYYFRDGRKLNA